MNNIKKLLSEGSSTEIFAKGYLDYLSTLLKRLDIQQIVTFIDTLLDARERGATIFFIGNGGSAATASHFANDIGIGSRSWNKPFKAIALTDNVAVITAIGNDYGYSEIFILQLKTLANAGDVLVAISASGNSENIIKAVQYANDQNMMTLGLTGFDGGKLKNTAQLGIHVECPSGEYGPVEDIHMVIDHLVGAYLLHGLE